MPYNIEIIKTANRIISLRREKSLSDAELRKAEVYTKVPGYYELKKEMIDIMGESLKKLGSEGYDIEIIKNKLLENAHQRKELLKKHGYPEDYTEEKFCCEKCSDKGYVGTVKCDCFKQILRETAAKASNLDSVFNGDDFSNFSYLVFSDDKGKDGISPRDNIKKIVFNVKNFIDGFSEGKVRNLMFTGKAGVGKTYMASCIAKKLLDDGFDVYYQTSGRITELMEDYRFKRNLTDALVSEIERLNTTDLLIIDDLGSEFKNSYTISILYDLINRRLMSGKKMIITTNYSLKELNEAYTERLFSRFVGNFDIFEFIGEDLRIKANI